MNQPVKLIECPRDAMQGWKESIPTATKVEYLNALLRVGFDTLDCGSFVSPKAIPQMADTRDVIPQLDLTGTSTKLLTIIANERGPQMPWHLIRSLTWVFPFRYRKHFSSVMPTVLLWSRWAG
ncbi:hypothetical protein [Paraflavitalea speifideaquila]|uniref:hypothetical protein n=1 Tax=Paraflavitalea speifideaquila TaxID=3076558 RepID=UPI0028EB1A15|nr:hypothetical protein [Paraflavitalea speifideiaquila]